MDFINDEIVEAANRCGAAKKSAYPTVLAASYDRPTGRIVISLDTGLDLAFSPPDAQGFENAHSEDLDVIEISPSGLGLHFPKIDADLYAPGLIEGFLGSERWMAAENGKAGGKSATPAKADAARQNGKLGGRPKKTKSAGEKS